MSGHAGYDVYAPCPRVEKEFLNRALELDDPSQPMAETNRRLRQLAAEMGIARPSYETVRRHLKEHRTRSDERARARTLVLELAYNTRPAERVVVDLLKLLE